MRPLLANSWAVCLALGWLLIAACGRSSAPPPPLSAQELPGALTSAFAKASPEAKTLAEQVVTLVQAQDYARAFQTVQRLAALPGLTKDQLTVASRAALTVSELLQAAQAQGDATATRTLNRYRLDK